jgi:hypothetical protein
MRVLNLGVTVGACPQLALDVTVGACPQLARPARRPGPEPTWAPCQARFWILGLIMCVMSNCQWDGNALSGSRHLPWPGRPSPVASLRRW